MTAVLGMNSKPLRLSGSAISEFGVESPIVLSRDHGRFPDSIPTGPERRECPSPRFRLVQVALSFDLTYYRQLRGEHAMICAWPEINGEAIK